MKKIQGGDKSLTARLPHAAMLTLVLAGLCAGLWAKTSVAQQRDAIVQNDIAVDSAPAPKARVALLLPARKAALADAAAAVQSGFLAALQADAHSSASIFLFETGEDNQANLNLYRKAQATTQLVIGPLSRNLASALSRAATVPTITLSPIPAEESAAGLASISSLMLAIGLSIEEEARQLTQWAHASEAPGLAWILTTNAPWQQRAAHAFEQTLRTQGRRAKIIALPVTDGVLDPERLYELREQAHGAAPALLLLALDYPQAIQLREALGAETPAYGTSQLNPYTAAQWEAAEPQVQLEGVRLLELPCRLQQRGDGSAETLNADLDRLQALGRDAYDIMLPLLAGQQHFSIEGDTGQLKIDFVAGTTARFSRKLTPAQYENGRVVALSDTP
jgi:hypothetical protein